MRTSLNRGEQGVVFVTLIVSCCFAPSPLLAQAAEAAVAANAKPALKFRPRATGAASVRVTGGSRGKGDSLIMLDVLAPDDVGITTKEQPSLFWYQSAPSDAKFEVTLLEPKKVKPLIHVKMDRASRAGIQRLNLSDHGVKLSAGVEYQWVVALITDAENRSTDLVASGAIKRIETTPQITAKLSKANRAGAAAVYADEGIWYDALASLSDQIEASPQDSTLRETRSGLLSEVGLKAAAQADLAERTSSVPPAK